MMTRTGSLIGALAFSRRTASRAPGSDASGPSLRSPLARGRWPDQASLPPGATKNVMAGVTAVDSVAATGVANSNPNINNPLIRRDEHRFHNFLHATVELDNYILEI